MSILGRNFAVFQTERSVQDSQGMKRSDIFTGPGPNPTESTRQPHPVRRILVDCSFTPLHLSPTGIPRVLRIYLTHAPKVAARAGVEFMPVEVVADGRFRRYREPGEKVARKVVDLSPRTLLLKAGLAALRYVAPILREIFLLVGAVLPLRFIRKTTARWGRSMDKLVPKFKRRFGIGPTIHEPVTFGPGDVLFVSGCWYNMDMADYEAVRAQGAEIVVLLHDIMPVTLPHIHEYPWRWHFKNNLVRLLGCVSHFYTISWQTLNDLKAFAAIQGREVRGAVAYNGFSPAAGAPDASGLTDAARAVLAERPWIMVGTVEPKKGHGEVVAAMEALWDAGYERPLVIIGRPGWHKEESAEAILTSRWLDKRLFWADAADDAALEAYYAGAHGYISASVQEGFGLPVLEAAARGLPVVVRDLPVFREILDEVGIYFTDRDGLSAAIRSLEDPVRLAAVRAAVAGLTWYDWPTIVEALIMDMVRAERRVDCVVPSEGLRAPVSGLAGAMNASPHAQEAETTEMPSKVASIGSP